MQSKEKKNPKEIALVVAWVSSQRALYVHGRRNYRLDTHTKADQNKEIKRK
jgi:hypothetical protein